MHEMREIRKYGVACVVLTALTASAAWAHGEEAAVLGGGTVSPVWIEGVQVADPGGEVALGDAEAAISGQLPAIEACAAKRKDPAATALALAYMVFDKKGKAVQVRVGGTGDAALDACTAKALGRAKLAKAGKGKVWVTADVSFGGGNLGLGTIGNGGGPGQGAPGHDGRVPPKNPVQLKHGQPTVSPGLDKEIVRRYLRRLGPRVQYCYEKQLQLTPELKSAQVVVQFTIMPTGAVTEVSATKTTAPADMTGCVVDAVKSLLLPKPESGNTVKVTYPFTFQYAD